ncbi:MAG TPA: hypothetical protein VG223_08770 [Solirubrobacteraceae bacterium]|nr:hypothetical protein [Solirubrobacteraceae bacterium]
MTTEPVYHVELKQGFNSARRFNLSRPQLEAQILVPWLAGRDVELDERPYTPKKAKLKVLAGPPIATAEMGLGRGWANAERAGSYVTDQVLAAVREAGPSDGPGAAGVEEFKAAVLQAASVGPVTLGAIVAMAGAENPRRRVSEQLALAERAVWELLHQGRLALYTPDDLGAAPRERWQPVLLAWASWAGAQAAAITVEAA